MGGLVGAPGNPYAAGGSGQGGSVFTPPNQPQEAQLYQQLIQTLNNLGMGQLSTYLPQIQTAGNQGFWAGQTAGALAPQQLQQGLNAQNMVSGLGPQYAAMVPQFLGQASQWLNPPGTSPIYQQMANRTAQGASAANAASGVYGPYAAGMQNEAQKNLAMNWMQAAPQNAAQLMSSGLGAGQGAMGAAEGAQNLGANAIRNYLSFVGRPSQDALSGTLGNIGQLTNIPQMTMQDILQYLNLGQDASRTSAALGNLAFQQQQAQQQGFGNFLGGILGGGPIGSLLFGPGGAGANLFGGAGLFPSMFGGGAGAGIIGDAAGLGGLDLGTMSGLTAALPFLGA